MKIAVPYEDGKVFQHFGRAREIKLYTVENGAVTAAHLVTNEAEGHGAVTRLLKELGVNIVICGNIGGCAQKAVRESGMELYGVLLLVPMMRLTHFYQIILHMTPR